MVPMFGQRCESAQRCRSAYHDHTGGDSEEEASDTHDTSSDESDESTSSDSESEMETGGVVEFATGGDTGQADLPPWEAIAPELLLKAFQYLCPHDILVTVPSVCQVSKFMRSATNGGSHDHSLTARLVGPLHHSLASAMLNDSRFCCTGSTAYTRRPPGTIGTQPISYHQAQ